MTLSLKIRTSRFYKIRLTIDKEDKTLVNYKVFDKNGNRYLWSVSDFDPSLKLTASHFEFDASDYKGVGSNLILDDQS